MNRRNIKLSDRNIDIQDFKNKIHELADQLQGDQFSIDIIKEKLSASFSIADAVIKEKHIDQAYYKLDQIRYIPYDGSGVNLSLEKGGDTYGESFPDSEYALIMDMPYTDGIHPITLYTQDQKDIDANKINQMIDACYERRNELPVIARAAPEYYNILSQQDQQDPELMDDIIKTLYESALQCEQRDRDYFDISPYGGLDITVMQAGEHFLESLKEYKEHPDLVMRASRYLMQQKDGRKFVEEQIRTDQQKLEYIGHKDEYHQVFKLQAELSHIYSHTMGDIKEQGLQHDMLSARYEELTKEVEELKSKTYHFWQSAVKRKDTSLMMDKHTEIAKIQQDIAYTDYVKEQAEINDRQAEMLQQQINDIKKDLLYPEFEDLIYPQLDDESRYSYALNMLCETEAEVKEELKQLQRIKECAPYTKRMDITVHIFQDDVQGNELKELNNTLKKIYSCPETYDTRLSLKVDEIDYLKDEIITDDEIKHIAPLLEAGRKTAIITLVKNALQDGRPFTHMRDLDTLETRLEKGISDSLAVEVDTVLGPSI